MPYTRRYGISHYGPTPTCEQWAMMLANWLNMWPDSLQARLPWGATPADPGGVSGWELDELLDDLTRTYGNALEWYGRSRATDRLWLQVRHMGAGDDLPPCPLCDKKAQGFEQALDEVFMGPWGHELAVDLCVLCGGPYALTPAPAA